MGPLVMYHDGGQQITRTNSGKNGSRTYAQVKQRIRFCNPSLFYRLAHNAFFRFAFDDQRPNESEYNVFMRHNLMNDTVWLTKKEFEKGIPVHAPYIVSKGSYQDIVSYSANSYAKIDLNADEAPTTLGEAFRAMCNNFPFVKEGDMMTILVWGFEDPYDPNVIRIWQRIIDFSNDEEINEDGEYYTDTATFFIGPLYWRVAPDTGCADAIVFSRNTANGLLVSPSRINIHTTDIAPYNSHITDAAMLAAIDSFGYQEAILNPKQNE